MKPPHLAISRRATTLALAAALVLGFGSWAFAEGELPLLSSSSDPTTSTTLSTSAAADTGSPGASTDSAAVATNTVDGRTVYAISLKIVQTASDTVDATNAAVAAASCTDCQTVAISLEAVLVIGSPTTFDPTNLALAINTSCTNCQTLASAYQTIVQNDTRVRISGAGRQEIAAIRRDLESLRTSGLDIVAVQQRVDEDAGRFLAVLQNEVYPVGPPSNTGTTSTASPAAAAVGSSTTTSTVPPSTTTTTAQITTTSTSTTTTLP